MILLFFLKDMFYLFASFLNTIRNLTDFKQFYLRTKSKNLKIKIYRNIIASVVLYGCETWSLTLKEERRLRVFENRILKKILGTKRDEVTGEWRKLRKEKLNDLYSSPDIVRVKKSIRIRWTGHVARMAKRRGMYRILVG